MSEIETKPPGWWARLSTWQQLAVVVVIGGVTLGATVLFTSAVGDGVDKPDEAGAQDVCEQFVEARLKAPSTAEFSGNATVTEGGGLWTVTGDVDAENSFGAPIRTTYVCTVKPTDAGGEDWELVNVELNE